MVAAAWATGHDRVRHEQFVRFRDTFSHGSVGPVAVSLRSSGSAFAASSRASPASWSSASMATVAHAAALGRVTWRARAEDSRTPAGDRRSLGLVRRQVAHGRRGRARIAHAADPVLGLPVAAALDAEAGAQRVMDGVAEELVRVGRRDVAVLLDGLAEQEPELRGLSRRTLEAGVNERSNCRQPREQEHAVDRVAARQVEEMHRAELVDEAAPSSRRELRQRHAVDDGERQDRGRTSGRRRRVQASRPRLRRRHARPVAASSSTRSCTRSRSSL